MSRYGDGLVGPPRSLAAALVTFANEIGATIIAEGVEIPGELATLRRIDIPWAQGYHLARPGSLPLPETHLATLQRPTRR